MQNIKIINGTTKLKKNFLKKLKEFSEKNRVICQAFNSNMVVSEEHLLSSVLHSLRAFSRKENIAKNIENEILLYASCESQIKNAIEKLGIKDERVCIVIIGKCNEKEFCSFLEIKKEKFKQKKELLFKFGISEEELLSTENATDLILEKIALMEIR